MEVGTLNSRLWYWCVKTLSKFLDQYCIFHQADDLVKITGW